MESDFELVSGGFGFGDSTNTKIFNHMTYNDGTTDYMVVISRDGNNAIRIYRTRNN
jgi:hypothetical protein